MKYSETPNTNTSKCEKTECLNVEIHKHHSKPFTYIVFSGLNMIGELVEDDITNFLSKEDLKKFYKNKDNKSRLLDKSNLFSVEMSKIKNVVTTPNNKYYNGEK